MARDIGHPPLGGAHLTLWSLGIDSDGLLEMMETGHTVSDPTTGAYAFDEVRQGIRIGERCVIGMGQRVIADCAAGSQLPSRVARA